MSLLTARTRTHVYGLSGREPDEVASGPPMASYSFLSKPKWLAFLLIGLVGLLLMPSLAAWQWRRYGLVTDRSRHVRERQAKAPEPFAAVLAPGATIAEPGDVEWRTVTITGTFDTDRQVLVRNRSQNGRPGFHVVTPLRLANGDGVLVTRGFVGLSSEPGKLPDVVAGTSGDVTVTGRVRLSQRLGSLGAKDKASGILTTVNRVDIERLGKQSPYRLAPIYVELVSQQPPLPTAAPEPVPLPAPDDGSGNISYMLQWIAFTIAGVVTWWLIIRRQASGAAKRS
jgi:cytochrome oxidase assembly protein ShyY1